MLKATVDCCRFIMPIATRDSATNAYPLLTDEHIRAYERALSAFLDRDWTTAWEELHKVPAADPSKDFLTLYIASRNRRVPDDWDGIIALDSK